MKRFIDRLAEALEKPLKTGEGQTRPMVLLWTDLERQWQEVIPLLKTLRPYFFTLGEYLPNERTGPAIWLRCIVDRSIAEHKVPEDIVPIIYLPGVERQMLRSAETCPAELVPLLELQYRGCMWHQRNGKDWTVEAFLVSSEGLGLKVATDLATREAAKRAMRYLAEQYVDERLKDKQLDSDFFNRLAIQDPIREILRWIGDPNVTRQRLQGPEWRAFCDHCKRELDFSPEAESADEVAMWVMEGRRGTEQLWERFEEAPKMYEGFATLLSGAKGQPGLSIRPERDPSYNQEQEIQLADDLAALAKLNHKEAAAKVIALEAAHALRRDWVWAKLDKAPLAEALRPLAVLAKCSEKHLGGDMKSLVSGYIDHGWRCDHAALTAMNMAWKSSRRDAVLSVIRTLYEPWLSQSAKLFQEQVNKNPEALMVSGEKRDIEEGTCRLFVDGLRFDLAQALKEWFCQKGLTVESHYRIAPFPTVTATGKPFAAGLNGEFSGGDQEDFTPRNKITGKKANTPVLRTLIEETGVRILEKATDVFDPRISSFGWFEAGRFDYAGHDQGVESTRHIDDAMDQVKEAILSLLEAGWQKVQVVTDHGWVLLPGGLPKVELPTYHVVSKWTRCAAIQPGAEPSLPWAAWSFDPLTRIAFAPGCSSFKAGVDYAHGGLSLQESVVPELIIYPEKPKQTAHIDKVEWQRLRCRVTLVGSGGPYKIDLRATWKNPETTMLDRMKESMAGKEVTLFVDDAHQDKAAEIVLIDIDNRLLQHLPTTVGGEQ